MKLSALQHSGGLPVGYAKGPGYPVSLRSPGFPVVYIKRNGFPVGYIKEVVATVKL